MKMMELLPREREHHFHRLEYREYFIDESSWEFSWLDGFFMSGKKSGKSLVYQSLQDVARRMSIMNAERRMNAIRGNLRKLKIRLDKRIRRKKISQPQKQQWRAEERRRSRQRMPGR